MESLEELMERINRERANLGRYEPHFAWTPVKTMDCGWIWLRRYYTRRYGGSSDDFGFDMHVVDPDSVLF